MRYELSVTLLSILSIALGATPICAGEPHAYLIALANDVTLPKDIGVKMDLAPDVLSYSLRTKSYPIDSRLRNAYPLEMKEVIGPSENGFIVRISVGPKGNLPMARHDGIYTARTIARPYWTERVYGYETPQGSLAILVQQGSKVDIKLLRRVENLINKRSSKWRSKE
jgi:hypothetical protein